MGDAGGPVAGMRVDAALRRVRDRLRPIAGEAASAEARMLVGHRLGRDLTGLLADGDRPLEAAAAADIAAAVARRLSGEPVQRILGEAGFFGLAFRLSAETLVPRPDTEVLVDTVLDELAGEGIAAPVVADLGVGSGAILVALLHALPEAVGVGVDLSADALATARANAEAAGVGGRATWARGSYAEALAGERFDAIVSNPPYIATAEIARLDAEVRLHDPMLALDGGADGLDAYRAIAAQAPGRLRPGGLLAVEIGWDQGRAVADLLAAAGLVAGRIVVDLAGRDRVVTARRRPARDPADGRGAK